MQPYRNSIISITSRKPLGTNVFDREWDVLIVLDTCRVDAMEAVSDEFSFIGNIDRIRSVGGNSLEWMAKTFDKEYTDDIRETAYLTGNPWVEEVFSHINSTHNGTNSHPALTCLSRYGKWNIVDERNFGLIKHIWKHTPDGKDDGGKTPARLVTDRAISIIRKKEFDKVILHYMQPHTPYVEQAFEENREATTVEKAPFRYLRMSGDRQTVFEAYVRNLRYVLADIELLLNNIDADTVAITADHGEAFGEWGIDHHHAGSLHPQIRTVPWVLTSAIDSGEYEPTFESNETNELSTEELLENLGYL